jgi:hypothetical protein
MNSDTLNPNHRFQIAMFIIAFVVLLVSAAWMYNNSITSTVTPEKTLTNEELFERRLGAKVTLSQEEQEVLDKRMGNGVTLDSGEKAILEKRLKSNN